MADVQFETTLTVEIFPDRIQKATDTPDGPVGQMVQKKATELLQDAIPRIGTRYSGTTGKVTDGRSGRLRDSGKVISIGGASYSVRFDHPIAALHHGGKRSGYQIPESGKVYILSNPNSPSRSGGGKFRTRGPVTWRGSTDGNPYLTEAALAVGLKPSGSLLRGTRPARIFRLRPI